MKQRNGQFDFSEELKFPEEVFYSFSRINGLKDVKASGHGHFIPEDERLYVDLHIEGTMIVPCAISLEDVDYPFVIDAPEIFAFNKPGEDEDVIEAKRDTADLTPVIFTEIMMAVPMRVVKEGATMKREGKGWRVIKESEIQKEEEDPIDPRLAKLKDYFKDNK
ncbi:MAG: YceD family protein [bacterium]